jgi:hypothetical protein
MSSNTRDQLIKQVEASQQKLAALFESVADHQDWQPAPNMWSFRFHAAHMATTDREAYWDRVARIAAGEQPYFEWYFNTGRDFSQEDIRGSLRTWATIRQQIIDFVRALPEEKLALTGTHRTFGPITVLDVLQGMLAHDREHLEELKEYAQVVLAQ